ncbi:MAG: AMP-binding protein [Pseudomonadales bacterium]
MVEPTNLAIKRVDTSLSSGEWSNTLLDSYVAHAASSQADRIAVIDDGRAVSYSELNSLIDRFASVLRSLGVKRGEVVSWQLPNWLEANIVHHAAIRIGAVSNPIVPIYRHREVGFILKQSRASVVIVPEEFRGFNFVSMIEGLRDDLPDLQQLIVVNRGNPESIDRVGYFDQLMKAAPTASHAPCTERSANDVAVMIYTSGTTSDPKGVLHTHNTLDYENRSIIELFDLNDRDVVFMPSPLAHITGVLYGLQLPFMLGSSVVLQYQWEAGAALALIEQYQCSFMIAATPFLHGLVYHDDLASRDVSSLRAFGCGGADVPPELIRQAEVALGCMATRVYGSSEFPTLSAGNIDDPLDLRATTDGRMIGHAEALVVDEGDQVLPLNTTGDLLVRGPELFVGYLDAELNEESFTEDGWFRSGDLAQINEQGFVTIKGRRKDIILRGAENISAKEIEDLLFEHPAVSDVAAVGMPDPVMVERICVFIVPVSGSQPSLADIVGFLQQHKMAKQKLPERIELVTALPMTASGKVQKFKLREDIARTLANEAS